MQTFLENFEMDYYNWFYLKKDAIYKIKKYILSEYDGYVFLFYIKKKVLENTNIKVLD